MKEKTKTNLRNAYSRMRKEYAKFAIRDKDFSIFSNNCLGADILHGLGMPFNSPTVNLQILPRDYIKFVSDPSYYCKQDVVECKEFTDDQQYQIQRTYGGCSEEEMRFPFGICGDILLCFQHYSSFDEAKAAWERRKNRICWDHLFYLFIDWPHFEEEMKQFDKVPIAYDRKIVFPINCTPKLEHTRTIPLTIPDGGHFMHYKTLFKKYYEEDFNVIKWINGVNK